MAFGQKTVIENGSIPSLSKNWDGIVCSCHIGAVMFMLMYVLMLMLINSIYPCANLVTKVTTAAP